MSNMTGTLGGVTIDNFTIPFLERSIENAADVVTLDGTMYTDFININKEWTINFEELCHADYDALRAVYDGQFSNGEYPTLVLPYLSIDASVRMWINEKNIQKDGTNVRGFQIRLRETNQNVEVLLADGGEGILLDAGEYLLI